MATTTQYEALIQELKKRLGLVKHFAKLGDSDDLSSATIDEPGRKGYVRVRLEIDDVPYRTVKAGVIGGYSPYPGSPVVVGYDEKGALAIEKADFDGFLEAGGNPLVLNSADNRMTAFNQTDGLLPLFCGAVSGTLGTLTNEVFVNPWRFVDKANNVQWFEGALLDLAALVPAANLHRYVAIFLRTDLLTFQLIGSTPIATITPLQEADKQECFDSRDYETIPVALWRLENAQTVITNANKVEDLRPWLLSMGQLAIPTVVVIDDTDSPYTIALRDEILFCDTSGGAITANLPAGFDGLHFKIVNTGANTLTVDPNGVEELYGAGAGVASTLSQGENIDIHYSEDLTGWW